MTDHDRRATDPLLDEAIDHAVREMMHVDPPGDMRARVLARIDAPVRPTVTMPRLVAAAALAAMVLLAFVLTRGPAPESAPVTLADKMPEPRLPEPRVPPAAKVTEPRSPAGGAGPAAAAAKRGPRLVNDDRAEAGATSTIALAPLGPIDRIVVAPLESPPVGPDAIVIELLPPLAELEIAPLFPSDGRD